MSVTVPLWDLNFWAGFWAFVLKNVYNANEAYNCIPLCETTLLIFSSLSITWIGDIEHQQTDWKCCCCSCCCCCCYCFNSEIPGKFASVKKRLVTYSHYKVIHDLTLKQCELKTVKNRSFIEYQFCRSKRGVCELVTIVTMACILLFH